MRTSLQDMSGTDFEAFLGLLFKRLGYKVQATRASGDYGADLLLCEPGHSGRLIAVQAKHLSSNVGVSAVQEVVASRAHYGADAAWVVTSSSFTEPARRLAADNAVMLVDGADLAKLMNRAGLRPRGRFSVWLALPAALLLAAGLYCLMRVFG